MAKKGTPAARTNKGLHGAGPVVDDGAGDPFLPDASVEPWCLMREQTRKALWAGGVLTVAQVAATTKDQMVALGLTKRQAGKVRELVPWEVEMVPVGGAPVPEVLRNGSEVTSKQLRAAVRAALRESFRGRIGLLEELADQRKNPGIRLKALRMMAEYGLGAFAAEEGLVLDEAGVRGLVHALALATEPFVRESDREGLESAWGVVLRQHLPVS